MPRLLACLFLPTDLAEEIARIQIRIADYRPVLPPHLTVCPPVDEGFPIASLREVAHDVAPLELTIGPSGSFDTEERVAFLRVGGPGIVGVSRIRATLGGVGDFAPHVTILRGEPPDRFQAALAATSDLRRTVRIDEVHAVAMTHDGARWHWQLHETVKLDGGASLL